MYFWWFLFLYNLLIPVTMIISGHALATRAPREINNAFGYRTRRSMRSIETWQFAHRYCGRFSFRSGWLLVIVGFAVQIPVFGESTVTVGLVALAVFVLEVFMMFLTFFRTEEALRKEFGEEA